MPLFAFMLYFISEGWMKFSLVLYEMFSVIILFVGINRSNVQISCHLFVFRAFKLAENLPFIHCHTHWSSNENFRQLPNQSIRKMSNNFSLTFDIVKKNRCGVVHDIPFIGWHVHYNTHTNTEYCVGASTILQSLSPLTSKDKVAMGIAKALSNELCARGCVKPPTWMK